MNFKNFETLYLLQLYKSILVFIIKKNVSKNDKKKLRYFSFFLILLT